MIIDSHCHAWRAWPYDTTVPDPQTRGSIESLLHEMDTHGVDHATVVCARIGGGAGGDGFANDDNNDYVNDFARGRPDRFTAWVDVDCVWRDDHHRPGSAVRLRAELDRTGARGFTHYVAAVNDGWLRAEGAEFFAVAAERGVIASLAITADWFDDLAVIAAAHPSLPILIHHLGQPRVGHHADDLAALRKLAAQPSIGVKVSGFNYNSERTWDFPYPQAQTVFSTLLDAFGPGRLCWGSDFPASRDMLTYRQALEVVRTHAGLAPADVDLIMGENLRRLLDQPVLDPPADRITVDPTARPPSPGKS